MRPKLRLLPGSSAIDPATNEDVLAAQEILREALEERKLTREEYRQECNEYWEECERQERAEYLNQPKPFEVHELTRDHFGYGNDRMEARYEHDLVCSEPIKDLDSAMQFLAENDCIIDEESRQELAHTIATHDAAVTHIDIAMECVYVTIYHIVPTEALDWFPFANLLITQKKPTNGGGGGAATATAK